MLGIDVREQRFPDELRYSYQPLNDEDASNWWCEENREMLLKNYNLKDIYI